MLKGEKVLSYWKKKKETERKNDLKKIAASDLDSLRKGTLNPEAAYRLYVVVRMLCKFDNGKAKKALDNFYSELKKHNHDLYLLLKGE